MDILEAIEWQKALAITYKDTPVKVGNACAMAIVALERQEGLKPITNKCYYFCPRCSTRRSIRQKHNYCHDCGQKLDWSDRDD